MEQRHVSIHFEHPPFTHDGRQRPPLAEPTGPGEESVWDYPRPPRIAPYNGRVVVRLGDIVIVDPTTAIRFIETASPPNFYVPVDDINTAHLTQPHLKKKTQRRKGQ